MTKRYKTSQEQFWVGAFGDEYSIRNRGSQLEAANTKLFADILSHTKSVSSVLELGANTGLNMVDLKRVVPSADLSAVEINTRAIQVLEQRDGVRVYPGSILDVQLDEQRDLVFTKGVLIHIDPDSLSKVYDLMYSVSRRYIGLVEYYNPTPVEVEYRGHRDKLFKRDFAGEMLDTFSDLVLVHYGFV